MAFITKQQLIRFDADAAPYYDALALAWPKFGIDTIEEEIAFLAQAAHETQGFSKFEENLNYSAAGLVATWPGRFTQELAKRVEHDKVKIANIAYASRYGNGPAESGDGWLYRGRGMFHLTFKDNYKQSSIAIYGDMRLVTDPDQVKQPSAAALTAAWFWKTKQLDALAKQNTKDSFNAISRKVNGGDNGLNERLALWVKLNSIVKGN